MNSDRQFFSNYFLYVGVISLALAGVTLGLMGGVLTSIISGLAVIANPEAELSEQGRTALDFRMQSLREVRQALARPLPPPRLFLQ